MSKLQIIIYIVVNDNKLIAQPCTNFHYHKRFKVKKNKTIYCLFKL